MGLAWLLSLFTLVALMSVPACRLARICMLMATALALGGCAMSPPFSLALTQRARTAPTPGQIAHGARLPTTPVAWGGTIVSIENRAHDTLITILAYPLNSEWRPRLQVHPLGRFIIRQVGFVEPLIYHPGRELTAIGHVTHFKPGKIGQQTYNYPVISAQAIHLWPIRPNRTPPQFQFGFGIGIGSRF